MRSLIYKFTIALALLLYSSSSMSENQHNDDIISFVENKICQGYPSLPKRKINRKEKTLEFSLEIQNAEIEKINISNISYSLLNVKGMSNYSEIGCPQIPSMTEIAAVNNSNPKIVLSDCEYIEYRNINIVPTQMPLLDADDPIVDSSFSINEDIYKKDEFYPKSAVSIIQTQKYKGNDIAFIRINPIQYNPVSKTVRCYRKIHFTSEDIVLEPSIELSNITTLSTSTQEPYNTLSNIRKKYIIVTTDEYKDALSDFCIWKDSLGYKVDLISKTSWSGIDEVKDSIIASYNSSPWERGEYLLIVGNHEDVPTKIYSANYSNKKYTSDHYYSCIYGNNNIFPDLARGRFVINSIEELNNIVQKTINYESNPSFIGKAVHSGFFQVNEPDNEDQTGSVETRYFIYTNETLRDCLLSHNLYNTIDRVYYARTETTPLKYRNGQSLPSVLNRPNFNWNGNGQHIIQKMNDGIDYVLYRGHSNAINWTNVNFTINHLPNLTSSVKTPFIFSLTCSSGEYAKVYEDSCLQYNDCLAKNLLTIGADKGAVGVLAATEVSFSYVNDAFAAGMFNSMYPNSSIHSEFDSVFRISQESSSATTIGNIVLKGYYSMQRYNSFYGPDQIKKFHIFGDPSTPIITGLNTGLNNSDVYIVNDSLYIDTNDTENYSVIVKPLRNSHEYARIENANSISKMAIPNDNYTVIISRNNAKTIWRIPSFDVYLQNKRLITNKTIEANTLFVGYNVRENYPQGNMNISNQSLLDCKVNKAIFKGGFNYEW